MILKSQQNRIELVTRPEDCQRERVEVDAFDGFGYTSLHYAAKSGLRKCVEYLVAHGADLFIQTRDGMGLTACQVGSLTSPLFSIK